MTETDSSYQVVILGGGASGCAAALAAAEAGASVCVVRRAMGATALSSGAVDLGADPLEEPGEPWTGRPSLEALFRLNRRTGEHPLDVAEIGAAEAHAILTSLAGQLSCLEVRPLDRPLLVLPTDLGTFKSTALASPWAAPGNLPELQGAKVGVAGIQGHPGHCPQGLCRSFAALARRGGVELEAIPLELPLLGQPGEELAGPVDLARLVERQEKLDPLLRHMEKSGKELKLKMVLLPAVMGLSHWAASMERIRGVLPAAEILSSSPPSVPGLRLMADLDRALATKGVDLLQGQAVSYKAQGSRLSSVKLAHGRTLKGAAFVLATGKFLGGGISHERGALREPLFDIPVWIGRRGPAPSYPGGYMSREVAGPHPLMTAGVRVDRSMQPLAAQGEALWQNLHASGSVLGGHDYISGRDGLGTAFVTGHMAGMAAAGPKGRV